MMVDHTPEPWIDDEMPEMPWQNGYIMLRRTDWQRAKACVNACAGIPTEQLEEIAKLADAPWEAKPSPDVKALVDFAEGFERYCGTLTGTFLTPGLRRQLLAARAALAPFLRKD